MIIILSTTTTNDRDGIPAARLAKILITSADYGYLWTVDGLPLAGDLATILAEMEASLLAEVQQRGVAMDLEESRAWALATVRSEAREQAISTDNFIDDSPTLAAEILIYFQAGRPTNPSAAVYVIADALANRRGATLRDTLEALLSRWRAVQGRVAGVVSELDRVEEELAAAGDVATVAGVLAGVDWGY